MSKASKVPVVSNRVKSAKIRNFDLNGAQQPQQQPKTSKAKLEDIHEFRQQNKTHDVVVNHVQFSASENSGAVVVVKENERPLRSAISRTKNNKVKAAVVQANGNKELISDNSFDSTDAALSTPRFDSSSRQLSMNSDSRGLKDRWKSAFRAIKQKFKTKPKYDEIEEIENNSNNNNNEVESGGVAAAVGEEDEDPSGLDLSGSFRNSANRRSTAANYDGMASQRRHTKESIDESKTAEKKFNNNHSYLRSAIPCFPLTLAIICFMLNLVLPGTGTILSGFLIICFGESRLATKTGGQKVTTLVVNILVGICQFVTIILLLVGWFWSIAWGVYIVIIALEKKRQIEKQKLRKKNRELKVTALKALGLKAL